ncbi:MAG TPA: hypothetical protein VK453_20180 [Micromonosporaceae bacterium]|nr:hypothetical protein [Micromonosporaceae bacterium]
MRSPPLWPLVEWLQSPQAETVRLDPQEWLGVVQSMTFLLSAQAEGITTSQWPACLAAYDAALRHARRAQALDQDEEVIRRLNLTGLLLEQAPAVREFLDPPHMVDLFLATVSMTAQEAGRLGPGWQRLERPEILRLRRVRALVASVLPLRDFVVDDSARAALMQWEKVLPVLP